MQDQQVEDNNISDTQTYSDANKWAGLVSVLLTPNGLQITVFKARN